MKKFIEFYQDPKKRILVAGPIYILFFVFVFTQFQFGAPSNISKEPETKQISKNNYTSIYKIHFLKPSDEPSSLLTISSKRYENMELYFVSETKEQYYREDNTLYLQKEETFEEVDHFSISLEKLTQENIQKYIEQGKEIYKTEFADGSIEKAYEITISNFSEMYDEKINQEGIITIKVKKDKNNINNISMDMKDAYFMEIEISYDNYGQVSEDEVLSENFE